MPTGTTEATKQITVEPQTCSVDADCPTGYICENGVCVEVSPPPSTNLLLILGLVVGVVAVTAVAAYYT